MKRRKLLNALGTTAVGTAALSTAASATTDPSNATATEVFQQDYGSFTSDDWNSGRVRVYGIDEYFASEVEDVCNDVGQFLDYLVDFVDDFHGFRLRGFTTNLEPFTGDNSSKWKYRWGDDYVDAFGHDSLGGGNVWLITRDSSGDNGTKSRKHNIAFGPKPYAYDSDKLFQYPHSFTRDNTVKDNDGNSIYWAACHELGHQLSLKIDWEDDLPNTQGDHYLASTLCDTLECYDQSSSIMARPVNTDYLENGDCTGDESQADSFSLLTSSCERTAFNESRLGVKSRS